MTGAFIYHFFPTDLACGFSGSFVRIRMRNAFDFTELSCSFCRAILSAAESYAPGRRKHSSWPPKAMLRQRIDYQFVAGEDPHIRPQSIKWEKNVASTAARNKSTPTHPAGRERHNIEFPFVMDRLPATRRDCFRSVRADAPVRPYGV